MSIIPAQTANVLGSLGGLVSGVGQFMSAREEVSAGDINATVYEQKAQAERERQKLLEVQKRKIIESEIGTQVSMFAKGGIKMTGSPIEVMMDSLTNANLDIAIDRYNSEVSARGFETDAQIEKYEARRRSALMYAEASSSFLKSSSQLLMTSAGKEKTGE